MRLPPEPSTCSPSSRDHVARRGELLAHRALDEREVSASRSIAAAKPGCGAARALRHRWRTLARPPRCQRETARKTQQIPMVNGRTQRRERPCCASQATASARSATARLRAARRRQRVARARRHQHAAEAEPRRLARRARRAAPRGGSRRRARSRRRPRRRRAARCRAGSRRSRARARGRRRARRPARRPPRSRTRRDRAGRRCARRSSTASSSASRASSMPIAVRRAVP